LLRNALYSRNHSSVSRFFGGGATFSRFFLGAHFSFSHFFGGFLRLLVFFWQHFSFFHFFLTNQVKYHFLKVFFKKNLLQKIGWTRHPLLIPIREHSSDFWSVSDFNRSKRHPLLIPIREHSSDFWSVSDFNRSKKSIRFLVFKNWCGEK